MVSTCPKCRGAGKVITNPCRKCKGTGRVPRQRTVSVKIPAGVHEGQGIRVTGEGEPGRGGGPRGDLYCYIRVKAHPFFMRDGNDLVTTVPISFTQVSLGATIEVPTLNGTRQLKILYTTQAEVNPPTFVFFVNEAKLMSVSYQRYLENKLRQAFGFDGTPLRFIFKNRGEQP